MLIPSDIRPQEKRGAIAAFYTVGGIMAAHELLETARDALFLSSVPASRLPWVYLIIAMLGMAIARGPLGSLGRFVGANALAAVLVGSALVTSILWLFVKPSAPWSLYATYVWSGVFATIVVVQFWGLLARLYTSVEAKRVFRFVGLGAIAGAIAGSVQAALLSAIIPTRHLMLAAAGTLLLAALGARFLAAIPPVSVRNTQPRIIDCVNCFIDHRYPRRLALMVLFATLSFTIVDYVFKSLVVEHVSADRLASFFAVLNIVLNIGSLLAQVLLTKWLLRVLGLHQSLAIFPLLIMLGTVGVAISGALLAVLILKGVDGTLRHSLHQTSTELLFVPMPDRLRVVTKELIGIAVQRGGQAIASLAILGATAVLAVSLSALAAAAALFAAGWLVFALLIREPYLDLFRNTLADAQLRIRIEFPAIDIDSLESVLTALSSSDEDEALAAIEVLVAQGEVALIPDLILYHPSQRVVLRALDLFASGKGLASVPALNRLLETGEPAFRAPALRARLAMGGAVPDFLISLTADETPEVRAVALVGLLDATPNDQTIVARLAEIARDESVSEHRAMAGAIADRPSPLLLDVLLTLANTLDVETRSEVCRALAVLKDTRAVPVLVAMLEQRAMRMDARRALISIGDEALKVLDLSLSDETLSTAARLHIPRTLSRFDPNRVVPIMLRHLVGTSDDAVRFKLLRGLGRIHADHPTIEMDATVLERFLASTITDAFRLVHVRAVFDEAIAKGTLQESSTIARLLAVMTDIERHAVETIFRVLALVAGGDVESMHRGLWASDPRARSSSRELVAATAPVHLRSALLALVDDLPVDQRLKDAVPFYEPHTDNADVLLDEMRTNANELLAAFARRYRAETIAPGGTRAD